MIRDGFARTVLLAGGLLSVLSCRPAVEEPAEIRIGVIGPFSGTLTERIGDHVSEGVRLAVDHAKVGKLQGTPRLRVSLFFADSQGRAESALEAARQLIHRDQVVALVGPCLSRAALAVAPFADHHRIPMISPTSTHPELTLAKPFVFRATIVDDHQAQVLARFARDTLEADTAAMLYDMAGVYNRHVSGLFAEAFSAAGGRIVAVEEYPTGARDFRDHLARLREAAPDVLLLPNYFDEVPDQVRQARELGIESIVIGTDTWDAEAFSREDIFAGSYFTDDWLPGTAGRVEEEEAFFSTAYAEVYGRSPTNLAAQAYDATGVLLAAVGRLEGFDVLEGEQIRRELADTDAYRGVTGRLSFRGGGDPAKPVRIYAIRDGGLSLAQRFDPASSGPGLADEADSR